MIRDRSFIYSVSILSGTIIGVGIFGIPFVFAKAGFLTGLFFLIGVWLLVNVIYLAYGEVVLRTEAPHQLIGYVNLYLGSSARWLGLLAMFFGIYGAMLAYLIIVGDFFTNILGPVLFFSPFTYSILFFVFCAAAILGGLKTVAWFELSLALFFSVILILVFLIGFGSIHLENLTPLFRREFWFLPYGVILFAFGGLSAVPLQKEILSVSFTTPGQIQKEKRLKSSIKLGTFIPFIFYLLFAILIVGVSGDSTTPESLLGIFDALGPLVVGLLSAFGILAITTTFLSIASSLKKSFEYDFKLHKLTSWFLTMSVPLVLYLTGLKNFIEIIGLVGAVGGGIEGILVMKIWQKAKLKGDREPEFKLKLPAWVPYIIMTLLLLGIIYSILN